MDFFAHVCIANGKAGRARQKRGGCEKCGYKSTPNWAIRCDEHVALDLGRCPVDVSATATVLDKRLDFIADELDELRQSLLPIDFSGLGLVNCFYLYCILIASGDAWHEAELPASTWYRGDLAPTRLFVEQMYLGLYKQGVLVPSVRSPILAFAIAISSGDCIGFDVTKVCWSMWAGDPEFARQDILARLRNTLISSSVADRSYLCSLLVQHECLSVLLENIAELGLVVRKEDELLMLELIKSFLRIVPAKALVPITDLAFSEAGIKRKLAGVRGKKLSASVFELLAPLVELVPTVGPSPSIQRSFEEAVLRTGKSLITKQFVANFLASS